MNMITICLTGESEDMIDCDITIKVPSSFTPIIQEMHIMCIHMICEYVEMCL